jgi:hypothetical protein
MQNFLIKLKIVIMLMNCIKGIYFLNAFFGMVNRNILSLIVKYRK